jgi:hypothetical protein
MNISRFSLSLLAAFVLLLGSTACGDKTESTDAASTDTPTEQAEAPDTTASPEVSESPAEPAPSETPAESESPAEPTTGEANEYPQSTIDSFINSCVQSAMGVGAPEEQANSYCSCAMDEVRKAFTYKEFQDIEASLQQGQAAPPKFDEIINYCASQNS